MRCCGFLVISLPLIATANSANLPDSAFSRDWMNRVRITGSLLGEGRWQRYNALPLKTANAASDLYLRLVELGIESDIPGWGSGTCVLNSEWIGDYLNQSDERLQVDELHVDLARNSFPLYFVFGKRAQPFGVFENHLISDPITLDAHETKKVGATVGYTGPIEMDLSLTAYKGDE